MGNFPQVIYVYIIVCIIKKLKILFHYFLEAGVVITMRRAGFSSAISLGDVLISSLVGRVISTSGLLLAVVIADTFNVGGLDVILRVT